MKEIYHKIRPFGLDGNLPFVPGIFGGYLAIDPKTYHIWAEDIENGWYDTGEIWNPPKKRAVKL